MKLPAGWPWPEIARARSSVAAPRARFSDATRRWPAPGGRRPGRGIARSRRRSRRPRHQTGCWRRVGATARVRPSAWAWVADPIGTGSPDRPRRPRGREERARARSRPDEVVLSEAVPFMNFW